MNKIMSSMQCDDYAILVNRETLMTVHVHSPHHNSKPWRTCSAQHRAKPYDYAALQSDFEL